MTLIYNFFLPLIFIILFSITIKSLFKFNSLQSILFCFVIPPFVLFISQFIFKSFHIGEYIIFIFAIIPIVIQLLTKRISIKEIFKEVISIEYIEFYILYILLFLININTSFVTGDDYSHWGVMIKEMIRLDNFYSVNESTLLIHKDYPPLFQLYNYFYQHYLSIFGEGNSIRFAQLFIYSLFSFPFLEQINHKKNYFTKLFSTLIIFIILYISIMIFDTHGIINSIYNDYFMSALCFYILITIAANKNNYDKKFIIIITLLGTFLILTKQIAVCLYIMVLFYLLIKFLINKKDKINIKKLCVSILILIIIPLLFYVIWNRYINILDLKQQFNTDKLSMNGLLSIFTNNYATETQAEISKLYINAIINNNLLSSDILNLSHLKINIILFILIFLINDMDLKNKVLLIGTLIIGSIGYSYVMQVSYVYLFGTYEALMLASFDRYLNTYNIIIFMIFLYFYIKKIYTKKFEYKVIILLLISILIVSNSKLLSVHYYINNKYKNIYYVYSEIIKSYTNDLSKVFIISPNTKDQHWCYYLNYYSNPRYMNNNLYYFDNNKEDYEDFFYNDIYKTIEKYDYMFLTEINDDFINNYKFLFESTPEAGSLYQIENNDGIIKFIQIS